MEFRIRKLGTVLRTELDGSMAVTDAARFRSEAIEVMGDQVRTIEADLSGLGEIDCTGLGVFVSLRRRCRARGGDLVIRGLRGRARRLFELTRLDRILTCVPDPEEPDTAGFPA